MRGKTSLANARLNITFVHVPGEADDMMAVWLPDQRILLSGDDIYPLFPNLYAIRGIARDPLTWAASLHKLRSLGADHLVPSHLAPVSGRQKIYDLFTVYSSAIQFVHDQTVRRLNEFHHPDDIGRMVRLPPSLASHPWLGEFYGTVEWSAKAIYQRYVGWFSGDPAELMPLTPSERSHAFINWIGIDRILDEADAALRSGRTQWSLELSGHVRRVQPDNLRARWLWMQSLRNRAGEQTNPTARNYFLTAALDSYGLVDWRTKGEPIVKDIGVLIGLMKYRLKAELTDGVNVTLKLHFTDTGATYRLQIIYSVFELEALSSDSVVDESNVTTIITTESVWRGILFGKIQPATAFTDGDVKVTGSLQLVRQFMSYF